MRMNLAWRKSNYLAPICYTPSANLVPYRIAPDPFSAPTALQPEISLLVYDEVSATTVS